MSRHWESSACHNEDKSLSVIPSERLKTSRRQV